MVGCGVGGRGRGGFLHHQHAVRIDDSELPSFRLVDRQTHCTPGKKKMVISNVSRRRESVGMWARELFG